MKHVLVIAYYFPPMGMGGVQRALKFTKYLPEFGWEPVVLTVKDTAYYAHDPGLLDEIPSARIVRTESLDPLRVLWRIKPRRRGDTRSVQNATPSRLSRFLSRLNEKWIPWIFVPDSKLLWLPFAMRAIRKIVRTGRIDAVLTTSPPHSAHLIGYWLKTRHNLPWIADFRDDWMTEAHEALPTRVHRTANDWLARRTLRAADRVVAVSPQIGQSLCERRGGGTAVTLYNGFDAQDFRPAAGKSRNQFTITYVGTLNPILDPTPFFAGMREVFERHPAIRSRIQIRLVGSAYGIDLDALIRSYRLEESVQIVGYVSHAESVRELLTSELLLFIMSPQLSAGRIPGKIFEYLASGKPILALVPESEAGRLIYEHNAGCVIDPGDTEKVVESLLKYFHLWETGRPLRPDFDLQRFAWCERREQTRRLSNILDVVSGQGRVDR